MVESIRDWGHACRAPHTDDAVATAGDARDRHFESEGRDVVAVPSRKIRAFLNQLLVEHPLRNTAREGPECRAAVNRVGLALDRDEVYQVEDGAEVNRKLFFARSDEYPAIGPAAGYGNVVNEPISMLA